MLRYLCAAIISAFIAPSLWAIPFYWEPKADEPGFTIDVPAKWSQASRARDRVANVHFERKDTAGRVAIEIRAYSSEDTDLEQLVLQLRTRLAVKYDRVFLVKRKELGFRKNMERQYWTARIGKKTYNLMTAFVVADDKVLQLICVAPVSRRKEYEYVFDNAMLSFDFSDGKPDSGGGASGPAEAPSAPAAAPSTAAPAAGTPAAPAAGKPPKIEF